MTLMQRLRVLPACLSLFVLCGCAAGVTRSPGFDAELPRAKALAQRMLIIDTHIDTPYRLAEQWMEITRRNERGEFDYVRAKEGGLDAPFMSIYIPADHQETGDAARVADRLIDVLEGIVSRAPDKFAFAHSIADLRSNFAAGKVTLLMGMENGAAIDADLGNVAHFRDRGIRYITLTHSKVNKFSDSSYDENRKWGGLSDAGKRLVRAMNDCGIMVDVSHVSDQAFYQAVEVSAVPVVATHSSPRHFTPGWERNMGDEMIRAMAAQGGVIQINFGSGFLTRRAWEWDERWDEARDAYLEAHGYEKGGREEDAFELEYRARHPYPYADLDDVLNAIDHVVQLVGIDHVGIGSDFDGVGDSLPENIKDVSQFPNLIAGLLLRGYSEAEIEQIMGGNLLRVWSETEEYARHRQCGP